eukprot:g5070.t1
MMIGPIGHSLLAAGLLGAVSTASELSIDVGSSFTSESYSGWSTALSHTRAIYGTMNGPLPVKSTVARYADVVPDTAGHRQSFEALGEGTAWVRFNDLGLAGNMSLATIFSAWPRDQAALDAADVAALAADEANYDYSGVDANVYAAATAGRNIDFRLGDCFEVTANYYPENFPASWHFPTNPADSRGRDLWAAVATKVALRAHAVFASNRQSAAQRMYFDLLTETDDGTGNFWRGTAAQYAALFAATMPRIKAGLGASAAAQTQFVYANNAYGTSKGKRQYFKELVEACAQLGYDQCPADIVAFHPFTIKPEVGYGSVLELAQYASNTVRQAYSAAGASPVPHMAITAWGLHGSGLYDMNHNTTGAAYVSNILAMLQSLPITFAIYYKFAGLNCPNLKAPCLVAGDSGAFKPSAAAFALHSKLWQTGTARVQASVPIEGGKTSSNTVVAVVPDAVGGGAAAAAAVERVSALIAAPEAALGGRRPANLQVAGGWGCINKLSTLTVERLPTHAQGTQPTAPMASTVAGAVRGDGYFHAQGNNTKYELQLGGEPKDAYVALLTLRCGDATSAAVSEQQAAGNGDGQFYSAHIGTVAGYAACGCALVALVALVAVRRRRQATATATQRDAGSAGDRGRGMTQTPLGASESANPGAPTAADLDAL